MAIYENQSNSHREEVSMAFLWTLLFGFFYFMVKGNYKHAIIGFVLGLCTFGISWFIYPFFASSIMESMYLGRGWKKVE